MFHRSHLLALFFTLAAPAFAEDTAPVELKATFQNNLTIAKFIGLEVNSELGAYTVRLYTEAQYNEKQASQQEYRKARDTYQERRDEHRDRMQELAARLRSINNEETSREETIALHHELAQTQKATPKAPPRQNTVELHRVAKFGADYLAVRAADDPDELTLIPYSRIGRIVITRTQTESTESTDE